MTEPEELVGRELERYEVLREITPIMQRVEWTYEQAPAELQNECPRELLTFEVGCALAGCSLPVEMDNYLRRLSFFGDEYAASNEVQARSHRAHTVSLLASKTKPALDEHMLPLTWALAEFDSQLRCEAAFTSHQHALLLHLMLRAQKIEIRPPAIARRNDVVVAISSRL